MADNSNKGCLWAVLIVLLCPWLVVLAPMLLAYVVSIFGMGLGVIGAGMGLFVVLPMILSAFLSSGWMWVLMLSVVASVLLPHGFVIYVAIRLVRGEGLPRLSVWLAAILIWLLSLGGVAGSVGHAIHEAGGIEALQNQMMNQTQTWEYQWINDNDEW